jgi:hypothetical protein
MKNYFLGFVSFAIALGAFNSFDAAIARQVCTTVTRYRMERYWTGKQWSSSSVPYFEQECRFEPDSAPQSPTQTPLQPQGQPNQAVSNQDLARQYLTQRYQACLDSRVAEPKCRCTVTRVANAYSADQIVQYAREQNAGFLLAEGIAMLACPSK